MFTSFMRCSSCKFATDSAGSHAFIFLYQGFGISKYLFPELHCKRNRSKVLHNTDQKNKEINCALVLETGNFVLCTFRLNYRISLEQKINS